MKHNTLKNAEKYTKAHQKKKRWYQVVTVLACVVVFCTVYALILPAITLENSQCEKQEHTHTQNCYTQVTSVTKQVLVCTEEKLNLHEHTSSCYDGDGNLVCGYADYVVHHHDSTCYDEEGNLWCPLPEVEPHTHDASCYAEAVEGQESSEPEVICGRDEIILHEHTSSCYDGEGNLICGKVQVLEHEHTDACFETIEEPVDTESLTCTLPENENHTHGPLCYGTWELTCGLEEHTHSEECFAKSDEIPSDVENLTEEENVNMVAPLSDSETNDTAVDVSAYITEAKLSYKGSDNDEWQAVTEGAIIPGDANLRLDVTYKNVPLDALINNGGLLKYELPSLLRNPVAQGEIISDGKTVGTITVEGDLLIINFDDNWLQELQDNGSTTLDGTFYVESQINLSEVGDGGQTTIRVGNVTIEAKFETDIIAKNADVDISKAVSSSVIPGEDGDYLEYTLTVTAGIDGCPDVKVVDTFTANAEYVTYVGVNSEKTSLDNSDSPCETIAEGMTHGYVRCETATEGETNSLVWEIGNMAAGETRTLTYRVKLKAGYTHLQNSGSKVISNEAQVYAKNYPRDSAEANFEPKAGLDMRKNASNAVRQEDGSYIITYTVWIEAYSTNNFVLDNVRIEDQLNHPNNATAATSLAYISYVDNSFKLYGNKNATGDPLEFKTSGEISSNPAMNADEKGFIAYVGDMEPGAVRCIQYQVRVGLEAIGEAGGKNLPVKNRALAYSDNAKNGANDWLQAYSNTKNIQYDHWAKKLVGDPLTQDANVVISGRIYDATGDTLVVESNPPVGFTAPVGSYQYTVTVNNLGDWDVTSASMKDTLGDQHMQFVGYVKVEEYDPDNDNEVKETIWVKVDGTRTFNFTLAQLRLTGNTYAYRLTYYAKPVQMEGVSQVVVANTFQLSGDIIIGESYKFILTGIEASAEVTVQGDNSFEAKKLSWYYEGAKTSTGNWSNGALYWVIKVDGSQIVAGTYIQDYLQTGSHYSQIYDDSLVGVYTSSLTESELTKYNDCEEALSSGQLTPVDSSYYSVEIETNRTTSQSSPPSTLTIKMEQTLLLDGKSMYAIVKTSPSFLPPHPFFGSPLYYYNYLRTSDDGQNWIERGNTSKILYEGTNIWKRLGTTFTYNGETIETKTSVRGGAVVKELLPESGYYVSWEIKVNEGGDLSGRYRILDTIPDGMELAYVRIKWRGTGTRNNPGATVTQIPDLGDGWTEHTVSAALDGESAMTTYYYTNGNQVCWDVDNLVAGKQADTYSVDFQVVCRVTDPDVLLGGEEKTFNNQVSLINSRGEQHDADTNGVTISTSTMTKSAVWSGSSIPFTITVNPLGEDLVEGAETLTVVDTLSDTLKLDTTSLGVVNTKTQAAVAFTASLDGQTLKIVVPDNQPLTISYRAKVQAAPNTEVAIKNEAHWEGYASTDGSSTENKNYKYAVGGTAGGTTTPFVEIVKYDQNNLTSYLAGATFKMVEGTMENGNFTASTDSTRVWEGTTDGSGRLKFGTNPLMAYNTVYQITETDAPSGYVLDSTPYYFIVAKANEDGTYPNYPDGVTVYYDSSTYTCEIANHKGEATVQKQFKDAGDKSLDKVTGTYKFGIYEDENTTPNPLQTVTITYEEDGKVTPESGKAKFTNLTLGSTYYIYELDDAGNPIKNDTIATVNGKSFSVNYTSGNAVTIPDNGTATVTITVTNRVNYSELPETGGTGTIPYTTGGLLLILSAGILLMYRLKIRRKEDNASS